MRILRAWATAGVALLVAPLAVEAQHPQRQPNPYEPGRTYTAWLLAGQTAPLWERFSPALRNVVGSEAALGQLSQQIRDSAGTETAIWRSGFSRSTRSTSMAGAPPSAARPCRAPCSGFTTLPERSWESPSSWSRSPRRPFAGYQTRIPLRLPFSGEWQISAGGNTLLENHHVVVGDQRFAYDITGIDENGLFAGGGARNEDYAGFGRPILAPAGGTVVEAVDGIPDNVPGQLGTGHIAGNRIVIDHGNGEYSMMAHFRRGTIGVRQGDRFASGQELGQCGNSGNSTGPHLHYHLQNTPIWGGGDGLPAQFRDYIQDGIPVDRGEPVRGQIVAPKDASGLAGPLSKRPILREEGVPRPVTRP